MSIVKEKTVVMDGVTTRLRRKSFAILMVNCRNKLSEERVEVGSVCELKGGLKNTRLPLFGE